jgi:putative membrane protein
LVPSEPGWGLAASAAIVAAALAHSITNIIPSIFFAVPEGDSALSVLPGHRMVRAGRGGEALRVSVVSSLVSLCLALVLLLPLRFVMGPPLDLYGSVSTWLGSILLLVSVIMVLKEAESDRPGPRLRGWRATLAAMVVFVLAGLLGEYALFDQGFVTPLFIGLFGIPTMIVAMSGSPEVPGPACDDDMPVGPFPWTSVVRGSIAGAIVGWFPGVSSAQATILAVSSNRGDGEGNEMEGSKRFIAGVSAVNTANVIFNLVALVTILGVRSGAAEAIWSVMQWPTPPWESGPLPDGQTALLVLSAVIGAMLAAPIAIVVGHRIHRLTPLLSRGSTLAMIGLGLAAICVGLEGWMAGGVLLVAVAIGMVPPTLGLMRVHLMGVVTLPLALGIL